MGAWALERAYRDGQDREARAAMSFVSLAGGLALANAKLGAVHGLAAPLGGITGAAHGVICARLLPVVMATNILLLQADAGTSLALDRYREVARLLTGDPEAQAEAGAAWVSGLIGRLGIPGLASLGLHAAQFPEVVAKAGRASSMQGNPVPLSPEVLTAILTAASEAPRRAV
jgi:alcohol dehydrogenase class IV